MTGHYWGDAVCRRCKHATDPNANTILCGLLHVREHEYGSCGSWEVKPDPGPPPLGISVSETIHSEDRMGR
jgi:hypothetical protein